MSGIFTEGSAKNCTGNHSFWKSDWLLANRKCIRLLKLAVAFETFLENLKHQDF